MPAQDERDFLDRAVAFANERLRGTLGCTLVAHPHLRRSAEGEAAFQRPGGPGVRHDRCQLLVRPGLCDDESALGGLSRADLADPQSGVGFVHNTYMFDRPLKTILSGPLTQPLKPLWFAGNKAAPKVSRKVVQLYHRPSVLKIPGLLLAALGG